MNTICYRCEKEVDRKKMDSYRAIELDDNKVGLVHAECNDFKTPYKLKSESRPLKIPKVPRTSYLLNGDPIPAWGNTSMEKIIPYYMEKDYVRWTPYLRILESVTVGTNPYQEGYKRRWSYGIPGNISKHCHLTKINNNVYKQPNFLEIVDSIKNSKPIKILTYDPCLFYGSHDESIPRVNRFLEVEIEFESITVAENNSFVGWTGNQKVSGKIEFDFKDKDMPISNGNFSFQKIWRNLLPVKPSLNIEDLKLILGHNMCKYDECA